MFSASSLRAAFLASATAPAPLLTASGTTASRGSARSFVAAATPPLLGTGAHEHAHQQQQRQQQQIRRWKHSATQQKRILRENPARLRIASREREGVDPNAGPSLVEVRVREAARKWKSGNGRGHDEVQPARPARERAYGKVFRPEFLSNGWSAPPGFGGGKAGGGFVEGVAEVPEYPFGVRRTGDKPNGAPGFLPVYSDVRVHGTKRTTQIRRITGDREAFLRELCTVLSLPAPERCVVGGMGGGWEHDTSSVSSAAAASKAAAAGVSALAGDVTASSRGITSAHHRKKKHGGGEGGRGVSLERPVRIRAGGTVEIRGDRGWEVRKWLAGLGF